MRQARRFRGASGRSRQLSTSGPAGRGVEAAFGVRPLGADRLAAPEIWAVRGRISAGDEDLRNHRGVDDRGDDLQASATVCAVFDIKTEYALEQAGPAQARGRGGWTLGVVIASLMGVERLARNDLG